MTYTFCALLLLNQVDCISQCHHYREGSVELLCSQKIVRGYDTALHHKNHQVNGYCVLHDPVPPTIQKKISAYSQ